MPKDNKVNLTQRYVDAIKPPTEGETLIMDAKVPGLGIRVRYTGKVVYVLRYQLGGRHKKMTIGDAKLMKLESARDRALEHLGDVQAENDPIAQRNDWRNNPPVRQLGEETIEHLKSLDRSPTYIEDSQRLLDRYILPAIGDMRVRDVGAKDIEKIIHQLKGKTRTGNLVRSFLSRMFKLARKWTYRMDDPTYGVEKFEEQARERFYSLAELDRLRAVLGQKLTEARFRQSAGATLLLLYTGARPRELFKSTWEMFDLDAGVWTKPSHHTKQKKVHSHKLAQEATDLLKSIRSAAEAEAEEKAKKTGQPMEVSPFVFPSDSKGGHLTTIKKFWAEVCKLSDLTDAHLYDLRKTFATLLLSRGVDIKTVMKLTGHTQATTLLKHYAMVVGGAEEKALDGLFG